MICSSALAALYKAEKTGKGESIDLAMYETLLAIGQYYLVDYLNEGIKWPRPGRSQPEPVRHRRVRVQGRLFGRVLVRRRPEQILPRDHRLGSSVGHRGNPRGHFGSVVVQPTCRGDSSRVREVLPRALKYEIEEDFAAHRIAAQVVNDFEELVEEEHLKLRDTWVDWETADGETFHGLGVFPKFKNNPGQIWRPMPHQGGDTMDVLTKLGYAPEQVEKLAEDGIVKMS